MSSTKDPWDGHPDVVRLLGAPPSRWADAVGRVLDPSWQTLVLALVVSLRHSPDVASGLGWAVAATTFCVVVPYAVLAALVGRGHVTDRQVVIREQRRIPLLAALASVVVGLVTLALVGAPRPLVALVATVLVGLLVLGGVSRWHKASFHTAVTTVSVVVLTRELGPGFLLVGVPVLALAAWARVRAGRHSRAQVVVGLLVGILVTALIDHTAT